MDLRAYLIRFSEGYRRERAVSGCGRFIIYTFVEILGRCDNCVTTVDFVVVTVWFDVR